MTGILLSVASSVIYAGMVAGWILSRGWASGLQQNPTPDADGAPSRDIRSQSLNTNSSTSSPDTGL